MLLSRQAFLMALKYGPSDETRNAVKKSPKYSLMYANFIDNGPHEVTRLGTLRSPRYALSYARNIDRRPHDVTRNAVLKASKYAYIYAKDIDQHPRDDTRKAAAKDPYYALAYMVHVDKRPHPTTYDAVLKSDSISILMGYGVRYQFNRDIRSRLISLGPEAALKVACYVDREPKEDTKKVVLMEPETSYLYDLLVVSKQRESNKVVKDTRLKALEDPEYAYNYALYIDKCPSDDTRKAACKDPKYGYLYAKNIDCKSTSDTLNAISYDSRWAYYYAKDVLFRDHPLIDNVIYSQYPKLVVVYDVELKLAADYRGLTRHIFSEDFNDFSSYVDSIGYPNDFVARVNSDPNLTFTNKNILKLHYIRDQLYMDLNILLDHVIAEDRKFLNSDNKNVLEGLFDCNIDDLITQLFKLRYSNLKAVL